MRFKWLSISKPLYHNTFVSTRDLFIRETEDEPNFKPKALSTNYTLNIILIMKNYTVIQIILIMRLYNELRLSEWKTTKIQINNISKFPDVVLKLVSRYLCREIYSLLVFYPAQPNNKNNKHYVCIC